MYTACLMDLCQTRKFALPIPPGQPGALRSGCLIALLGTLQNSWLSLGSWRRVQTTRIARSSAMPGPSIRLTITCRLRDRSIVNLDHCQEAQKQLMTAAKASDNTGS
jgi:hypothetical protein